MPESLRGTRPLPLSLAAPYTSCHKTRASATARSSSPSSGLVEISTSSSAASAWPTAARLTGAARA
eukprot:6413596-Lingulodinium_polyedra.AAC.1